jgi:tetratricopeptide (TPR) repeat protein
MKLWMPFLLALMMPDPIKIGKINSLKEQARQAFRAGDYQTAAARYRVLTDSMQVQEDEVQLNLAHAYFQLNDTAAARQAYQTASRSANPALRSIAHQQLGTLLNRQGRFEDALAQYKNALRVNPANEDARYNYELLKKKLEEQKQKQEQQNKDQQNDKKDQQKNDPDKKPEQKQDQEKKDQPDKSNQQQDQQKDQPDKDRQKQDQKKDEQQNKTGNEKQQPPPDKKQEKEMPPEVKQKLQEMKMSEEKARMILEAMKNQEAQYLQQKKRKATRPPDKTKPEW